MADEEWNNAYANNQQIWESADADPSSKMCAWRRQRLLLQHATREMDDRMHRAVINDHEQKLDKSDCVESYFQERLGECQELLARSRRNRNTTLGTPRIPLNWTFPDKNQLELPCRGKFESCKYDEIASSEQTENPTTPPVAPAPNIFHTAHEEHQMTIDDEDTPPVRRPQTYVTIQPCPPPRQIKTVRNTPEDPPNREMQWGTGSRETQWGTGNRSDPPSALNSFRTAREDLQMQENKKNNPGSLPMSSLSLSNLIDYRKKPPAARGVRSKFISPVVNENRSEQREPESEPPVSSSSLPPALAKLNPEMVEQIMNEIMLKYKNVDWKDIAGLDYAKSIINEVFFLPLMYPDVFKGLRRPPRGILLFGPPGTGKTMIGKCIACQANATFFNINPSTLTSKWLGDSEKLVKTLFAVAAAHQPAVIFMDEVDSLLSQRSENQQESSRRMKNEFLIQLDGVATSGDEKILIMGATNRPEEIDDAVRRRFQRRLYVPLPDSTARQVILKKLIKEVPHELSDEQIVEIANLADGYSGADLDSLCYDAAMQPTRSIDWKLGLNSKQLRPVNADDFRIALENVAPSVSPNDIEKYVEWNKTYGAKAK